MSPDKRGLIITAVVLAILMIAVSQYYPISSPYHTYWPYPFGCSPLCPVVSCAGAYIPPGQCCAACPNCAAVSCPAVPTCSNPVTPPGQCCPVCNFATAGTCVTATGMVYAAGQTFQQDCNTCSCNENGAILCTYIQCATTDPCATVRCGAPLCTNPTQPAGQCCPSCTQGCLVNGVTYAEGQTIPCGGGVCTACYCRMGNILSYPTGYCFGYGQGPYYAIRG